MENFSLLYPAGTTPAFKTLGDNTINDLSLEYILDNVAKNAYEKSVIRGMLLKLESDPSIIRYRCDVFEDVMNYPALRDNIKNTLDQLEYLKSLGASFHDDTVAPLWQLINRLHELEVYIDCIADLHRTLTENPVKSEGLRQLRDYVAAIYNESGFEYLRRDIKSLLTETSEIKSITLGVNLDSSLRPVEVGIMSINHETFNHTGILDRFIGFLPKVGEMLDGKASFGMSKMRTVGTSGESDPLMNGLCRAVTEMLGGTVKNLKSTLSRYVNISGYSLTRFIPEFIFYTRWADFCSKVIGCGLPMARPEILSAESKSLCSKGIYNLKMAIQILGGASLDVVRNDFEFAKNHGIYIMTGPNKGGKTTFTQAIGILFLLAQHGIYVPAQSVSLSPCDNIFTHFPADENQTVNLGRLGEESMRISAIFTEATDKSLLLFNESLATTSFTEGLYIAKDVVRAMRCLGARTVFNTHMHDLAADPDEFNSLRGDLDVASLITGVHEGQRSYKVYLAPPEGVSYARDIAEKYGVSFAQLQLSMQNCA